MCSSANPSSRSSRASEASASAARRSGSAVVICEPMWTWTPDEPQARQTAPLAVDRARLLQRHAELVGLQPGGDVRMAPGVDVGVDAQRHARLAPLRARDLGDAIELAGRFRVDRADAVGDRVLQLVARLADAGEDDVAPARSRRAARPAISPPELASARLPSARSRRAIASVELAFSA